MDSSTLLAIRCTEAEDRGGAIRMSVDTSMPTVACTGSAEPIGWTRQVVVGQCLRS